LRHLLSDSLNSILQVYKYIETTNAKIEQTERLIMELRSHLKKLVDWATDLEEVESDSMNKMQMVDMVQDQTEKEYLKNVMDKEKKSKIKMLINKIENLEYNTDSLLSANVIIE